ncbi:APC family permease [Roseimaritima ulvae]|uniref:Amino acid permease n=1 Tax=Roseimaritima ulvae TaxID=980254 RepID=A0A5B9QUK9_9BACT|nr:amino acid permease [Roseimaritima ulvae]QEG41649.1 Amino acid permease [Roseimaritima ulvae]
MSQTPGTRDEPNGRFGTFEGVFTPCVLTILGVIMFLRFGFVVGQAGLVYALLIVAVSKLLTGLTTLSLSAIATNTRVQGGGAYFLISRSLGVEFGGAIGLVFFLAQAISVAMYVIGFSEAFVGSVPSGLSVTVLATITNVAVFMCVIIGAGWTIKLQFFILATLALSLVSFTVGAADEFRLLTLQANMASQFTGGENLFSMFALFFPAVTGIMAGANMSGDLRAPAKSIPQGTLWAIAVTALIYVAMAVLLAASRPGPLLTADSLVVADIARWPLLITAGVFAATLSSALGSMMGAPRILQAFAKDNVFAALRPFAHASGTHAEPRRAILLTFFISQLCILVADLNTIAPLITMCFMVTYGLLNLATFYEAITKNPSYRPQFRFCHWSTSLAGTVGCLVVMFLIDWRWATFSILAIGLLHWYISCKEVEARWGNVQSGLMFERTRHNLLRLEAEMHHPKNWRPIILSLVGAAWDRPYLATYGHWFTSGHGILALGQVIHGDVQDRYSRRFAQESLLDETIRKEQLEAFPAVCLARTLQEGIESLVQCQGLGALRPNTVLLGWPRDPDRAKVFGNTLQTITALQRSIVAMRVTETIEDAWAAPQGTVDVWWRGRKNGELMLLLAHLLTKNTAWRARPIRLLRVIENEAGCEDVVEHLTTLAEQARIRVQPQAIVASDPGQAIRDTSRNAALVIMGFAAPQEGEEVVFYERMQTLAADLPRVVFVDSVGGMSLDS